MSLVVQVLAVHHEDDLVDFGELYEDLTGLEGGEGFPRSGGMPDIAVLSAVLHPVDDGLHGIELVGAEHHEDFIRLVEDNVLGDHFAHVAGFKELPGEVRQLCDGPVFDVRPVKGLFEGLLTVVGVILGVDPVTDDKDLQIHEQAA